MSVTPLNPEIEEFKKLQELLGAHQTLPVLLATLEKGLKLKTDLKEISALLGDIFHSDDDKFWGNLGSIYYKSNREALNLDAISQYKFEDNAYLEFFDFIAKIIENFDLNLVPTFSQYDFIKTLSPILHSENSLQDDNKAINGNSDGPFRGHLMLNLKLLTRY